MKWEIQFLQDGQWIPLEEFDTPEEAIEVMQSLYYADDCRIVEYPPPSFFYGRIKL